MSSRYFMGPHNVKQLLKWWPSTSPPNPYRHLSYHVRIYIYNDNHLLIFSLILLCILYWTFWFEYETYVWFLILSRKFIVILFMLILYIHVLENVEIKSKIKINSSITLQLSACLKPDLRGRCLLVILIFLWGQRSSM